MFYKELPLFYGRLNPEISRGFDDIIRNIDSDMRYEPIESLRTQISDIEWMYEVTIKILKDNSEDESNLATVIISKTYDEKNHENIFKLIEYREQ